MGGWSPPSYMIWLGVTVTWLVIWGIVGGVLGELNKRKIVSDNVAFGFIAFAAPPPLFLALLCGVFGSWLTERYFRVADVAKLLRKAKW